MNLLIVDDDFNARSGLVRTLSDFYPQAEIHEADSLRSAIETLDGVRAISLVLVDLMLGDSKGMNTLVSLKEWCAKADFNPRLVVVSGMADLDNRIIVQAIDNCATGFITKGTRSDIFRLAIDLTVAGSMFIPEKYLEQKGVEDEGPVQGVDFNFTPREKQVGRLLVQGLTYRQIAEKLQSPSGERMSEHTARVHVQHMAWKVRSADDDENAGSLSARAVIMTAVARGRIVFV